MCKTYRTQNICAPTILWYSCWDIWRQFQPSHLKNHEFHFFTKLHTSHLAMPRCTDQLGHVQNPPNSKLSCTKNFMVFIWGHLEAFPTLTSQKPRISFFHKTPHQAIWLCRGAPTTLPMCKTQPTQNFCAPRLSWYSFGGIWRPFQPSHLKNHEFHFFTKLPTKQGKVHYMATS